MSAMGAAVLIMASAGVAPGCVALADLTGAATFAQHPASPARAATRWHQADTRAGEARRFRTVLREATREPPNFAAGVSVVEIGCGAGAICPAFVDRITGRVWFEPALRVVSSLPGEFDEGRPDYQRLTYRRDSRLLVAIGSPDEDPARAGAHSFRLDGGRLRPVGFVPMYRLCRFAA